MAQGEQLEAELSGEQRKRFAALARMRGARILSETSLGQDRVLVRVTKN